MIPIRLARIPLLLALVCVTFVGQFKAASAERPNIILMLADD